MATKNTKRKKKNQRKAKNLVFILGITVIVFVAAKIAIKDEKGGETMGKSTLIVEIIRILIP